MIFCLKKTCKYERPQFSKGRIKKFKNSNNKFLFAEKLVFFLTFFYFQLKLEKFFRNCYDDNLTKIFSIFSSETTPSNLLGIQYSEERFPFKFLHFSSIFRCFSERIWILNGYLFGSNTIYRKCKNFKNIQKRRILSDYSLK